MRWLRVAWCRVRTLVRPHAAEREWDDEIAGHLAESTEEYVRSGLSLEEAMMAARRDFGGVIRTRERLRDRGSLRGFETLLQDLAYGVRLWRRKPGFPVIALTTLSLGIGLNAAIYSIVRAVLLQPLPYREPEQLVAIWDRVANATGTSKLFAQYRDLERWQAASRSVAQLGGITWATGDRILTGYGPPRNVLAIPTTQDFFRLLGVGPLLGRTFDSRDLARACTVVLAHRFWRDVLGGPENLDDLKLALDDRACVVIGVMPPAFTFFPDATTMWVLLTPDDPMVRTPERVGGLGVFGRLRPGVSIASAQSELAALSREIDGGLRYGVEMEPRVYPLQGEFAFLANPNLRLSVLVPFGAVTAVLLIACLNVANLLIGRSLERQHELALRAALGSGRGRLLRQLLAESLALSMLATLIGVALATGAVHVFRIASPVTLPVGAVPKVDMAVLAFAAAMTIFTTIAFGLLPAWKSSRIDLQTALKAGARGATHDRARMARGLIAAEISLSVVLLVGAGLLIESVVRLASAPVGFEPEGLMTMSLRLPSKSYSEMEQRVRFFDQVAARLRAIPDVQQIAFSTILPLHSGLGSRVLLIEGHARADRAAAVPEVGEQSVSSEYFRLMGIPLETGRTFDDGDGRRTVPVAIVNEALAKKYFPAAAAAAIGQRIRFDGDVDADNPWLRIVGIVGNEVRASPYQEMTWRTTPFVYRPLTQKAPSKEVGVLLRTRARSPALGGTVQREIASVEPGVVTGEIETADRLISRTLSDPRFRALLLGLFAGMALLLAVVGLYGVLSNLVGQRSQEIGLRMALGAKRGDVLALVLKDGMLLAGLGVAIGLVMASWTSHLLASLLFGITPRDPITLALASLVLLGAAFVACFAPAQRAAGIDAMVLLRRE